MSDNEDEFVFRPSWSVVDSSISCVSDLIRSINTDTKIVKPFVNDVMKIKGDVDFPKVLKCEEIDDDTSNFYLLQKFNPNNTVMADLTSQCIEVLALTESRVSNRHHLSEVVASKGYYMFLMCDFTRYDHQLALAVSETLTDYLGSFVRL